MKWFRGGPAGAGVVAALILAMGLSAVNASPLPQSIESGAVVALRGTPHLWFADERGVLHWGGDTRALTGKMINWNVRRNVELAELRRYSIGDPWLSLGLLKDGDPIYLVKWETHEAAPRLLHIQSIADVEFFGINGSNYGRLVLDRAAWERRFGMSAANFSRAPLGAAVPAPRVAQCQGVREAFLAFLGPAQDVARAGARNDYQTLKSTAATLRSRTYPEIMLPMVNAYLRMVDWLAAGAEVRANWPTLVGYAAALPYGQVMLAAAQGELNRYDGEARVAQIDFDAASREVATRCAGFV